MPRHDTPRPTRQVWDHETVLASLRAFVHKHGRWPQYTEYTGHRDGLPSRTTVERYCPTFMAELRAEGFDAPAPERGSAWRTTMPVRRRLPGASHG